MKHFTTINFKVNAQNDLYADVPLTFICKLPKNEQHNTLLNPIINTPQSKKANVMLGNRDSVFCLSVVFVKSCG